MSLGLLGMLGIVPFVCSEGAVATFRDVKVQRSSRYAQHDVLGQKPVQEYIGPAATSVSFSIQLRSYMGSMPAMYLAMLREMLDSGEAQRLLMGPDYFGKYIIENFSEDRKYFNGLGVCQAVDVSLSLKEADGFSLLGAVTSLISGG